MTALFFVCLVACIFAGVVMAESQGGAKAPLRFGSGLIGWLVSGNWPAKVGGILLIVGIGALLRYALIHVEVPPESKLLSGGVLSAALFIAAHWVRTRFGRREIAIALAGAAFGTAYLTAYSAYAFFGYVNDSIGLSLLVVVSLAAGAYAVIRHALSLTLLSMFGAFLAPAFALEQPSAGIVYGYYLALSQLALIAVAMRRWRALIHLSFLFTLAGGVFFAWTAGFYSPDHFITMQPLLLGLVAIHAAMPLVEQRAPLSQWMARFDLAYFITLPIVSVGVFALIAPSVSARGTSWVWLGAIWLVAALAMQLLKVRGVTRHMLVGGVLIGLGLFVKSPELPWLLIAQGVAVLTLCSGKQLRWARTQQDMALLFVLAFTGLFVADTLREHAVGLPFANRVVIQQLASCALLTIAWRAARGMAHPLSPFVGWLAFIGFANTAAAEFTRWQIASWPLILHVACVLAGFAVWFLAARRDVSKSWVATSAIAITFTAAWAADRSGVAVAGAMTLVAPLALIAVSLCSDAHESSYTSGNRLLAMTLAPLVAWIWARPMSADGVTADQFALTFAVGAAVAGLACARLAWTRAESWIESAEQLFAVAIGAILLLFTLFHIERGVWPILLEVLCVAGLVLLSAWSDRGKALYVFTAIGIALTAQAMLLRALGPDGVMTVFDALDLRWPAVISLFWASLGCALTIAARRIGSRTVWSIGAIALVACAIKIVLLDFGSLGELENILAVIAAGAMFMLVSWIAPLPPKTLAAGTA